MARRCVFVSMSLGEQNSQRFGNASLVDATTMPPRAEDWTIVVYAFGTLAFVLVVFRLANRHRQERLQLSEKVCGGRESIEMGTTTLRAILSKGWGQKRKYLPRV